MSLNTYLAEFKNFKYTQNNPVFNRDCFNYLDLCSANNNFLFIVNVCDLVKVNHVFILC